MPTILFFHPDLPYGARRNDCGRCQVNSHCLRTAASATTTEADSGYNSCGNTVGAVIPTARACSARGLYRRSGFSPCPEDMRLQTYINFRKNNRIIHLIGKKLIIKTICNIFANLNQKVYHLQPARMAESVDALVSNTSGAIRAGSIPAPGTTNPRRVRSTRFFCFSDLEIGLIWSRIDSTLHTCSIDYSSTVLNHRIFLI